MQQLYLAKYRFFNRKLKIIPLKNAFKRFKRYMTYTTRMLLVVLYGFLKIKINIQLGIEIAVVIDDKKQALA